MKETLWRLFCETGDPLAYLLYRMTERQDRTGEKPEKGQPFSAEKQTAG